MASGALVGAAGLAGLYALSKLLPARAKKSNELDELEKANLDLFKSAIGTETVDTKNFIIAKAPGRVNLIGEHVDYNMGFVMPIAIDRATTIVGSKSSTVSEEADFIIAVPNFENPGGPPTVLKWKRADFFENSRPVQWHNYVRGVVALIQELKSIKIPNFHISILGNVPQGGGLSSSASLEVATATFIEKLCGIELGMVAKAELCQKVEHTWCDVPCGIMDQFASVFGKAGHALLIDCKSITHKAIPMTDPNFSILIVNSNTKHALVDGAYKKRKSACDSAADKLNVQSLREISAEELESKHKAAGLTPLELRRARHVVNEIERTEEASRALRCNDYELMGKLMIQSHESLRDLYEVSCEELDYLVKFALECKGVYGARMTGAGFGGSIVALVETKGMQAAINHIDSQYTKATGKSATFISSPPSEGASAKVVEMN